MAGPQADIAHRVSQSGLNPRLLSSMASHDLASNIRQTLARGDWRSVGAGSRVGTSKEKQREERQRV
jgi:hypothetical protein